MYEIKADIEKNRIYVRMSGFMEFEEVKKAADEFIEKVKTLKPGCDVINDVSDFKPSTPEGADQIKRAQAFLAQYGMAHVIRVVPGPVGESENTVEVGGKMMGTAQIRRTAREVGYKADEAGTLAEAEAILDKHRGADG